MLTWPASERINTRAYFDFGVINVCTFARKVRLSWFDDSRLRVVCRETFPGTEKKGEECVAADN